jgi:CheY-like chemotaxis protein
MDKSARILLVEDNPADIDLTLDAFRSARLTNQIDVCRSGEEALDYLHHRGTYADSQHPHPHIVLLDLKLPGLDGLEVLGQVKQTPVLKRIPVIILTSSDEESDRVAGYDGGANSYLVKPVTVAAFLDVARQVGDYWLTLNMEPPLD